MRAGSLFSGYGGLDWAVEEVFGARTAWHSQYEPPTKQNPKPSQAPSKLLAYRTGQPNHGDITTIDWAQVEPIDILCGGWPCQPFSLAGKQLGAEDDRALWPYVARAIRLLRPRIVCLENVPAVLTAGEFDRVTADLAALGYQFTWTCLRASDVGAPHQRKRLFILARDAANGRWDSARPADRSGERPRPARGSDLDVADTTSQGRQGPGSQPARGGSERGGQYDCPGCGDSLGEHHCPGFTRPIADPDGYALRQQPVTEPRRSRAAIARCDLEADSNAVAIGRGPAGWDDGVRAAGLVARYGTWGDYEPAIRRWERVLGRVAPAPTELNTKGGQRLSPRFVEWMMGLPVGHVTDVPGISRNDQLKMLGNGVVPQQATEALRRLTGALVAAPVAAGVGANPADKEQA